MYQQQKANQQRERKTSGQAPAANHRVVTAAVAVEAQALATLERRGIHIHRAVTLLSAAVFMAGAVEVAAFCNAAKLLQTTTKKG